MDLKHFLHLGASEVPAPVPEKPQDDPQVKAVTNDTATGALNALSAQATAPAAPAAAPAETAASETVAPVTEAKKEKTDKPKTRAKPHPHARKPGKK